MKPAIEVKNISKSYQINHKNKASYSTLKDDFGKLLTHPFRKDATVDKEETFWALDDVSFDVNPGEIFGIVGRNGSGKSTLLKILSRIVEPTKGSAILRGRVASLLEVGTGFNPELTGRENIYFNGSMLGMSRQEINKKFNEIVWFSEVEKFIDTPVKFYSSGMYVRLAFSVAAHLEPEILILDEVLAVGDASFQEKSRKKILGNMEQGSTVLFVSHSVAAVKQLCSRGVLLNSGKVEYMGDIDDVIEHYTGEKPKSLGKLGFSYTRSGAHDLTIEKLTLLNGIGVKTKDFSYGDALSLKIELNQKINTSQVKIDFNIINKNKEWVSYFTNGLSIKDVSSDVIILKFPNLPLAPGDYSANIAIHHNNKVQDFLPEAISFKVKSSSIILPGVTGVVYYEGQIISNV